MQRPTPRTGSWGAGGLVGSAIHAAGKQRGGLLGGLVLGLLIGAPLVRAASGLIR